MLYYRHGLMPTIQSQARTNFTIIFQFYYLVISDNPYLVTIRDVLAYDDVIKWKHFPFTDPFWGNSPVTGESPSQKPLTPSFNVFFDLCLNKRLSKQSWGWWFKTTSRSLRRHCNERHKNHDQITSKFCTCANFGRDKDILSHDTWD